MSFNTVFSNYEDVINFLKNHDYPQCFTVNYRPNEDDFEIWIGNQPYETYEQIIESLEESLNIARVGRRDLTNYVKQLKKEIEGLEKKLEGALLISNFEFVPEKLKPLKYKPHELPSHLFDEE